MTAFAISARPDRLVIASDTLGYLVDAGGPRPLGFVTKVVPLPHLRAAIFGRGMNQIVVAAAMELLLQPQIIDIEAAVDVLPGLLNAIATRYANDAQLGNHTDVLLLECVLAGWSERDKRMRLWSFENYDGFVARPDSGTEGGFKTLPLLPADRVPKLTRMKTEEEQLIALILAIGQMFADHPEWGCAMVGGEIRATVITPHMLLAGGLLYRFPDYEQVRNASAAVAARVLRGDMQVDVAGGLTRTADGVDIATGEPLPAAKEVA